MPSDQTSCKDLISIQNSDAESGVDPRIILSTAPVKQVQGGCTRFVVLLPFNAHLARPTAPSSTQSGMTAPARSPCIIARSQFRYRPVVIFGFRNSSPVKEAPPSRSQCKQQQSSLHSLRLVTVVSTTQHRERHSTKPPPIRSRDDHGRRPLHYTLPNYLIFTHPTQNPSRKTKHRRANMLPR